MEHELISGSTAARLELAPVHSGSHAIGRHAEEGCDILDGVEVAITQGASHQRVTSPRSRVVRDLGLYELTM